MQNKRNYRIFGLRRSGNHVFANWLIDELDGNVDFYNNVSLHKVDKKLSDFRRSQAADGSSSESRVFSFEDRNLNVAAHRVWVRKAGVLDQEVVTDFIVLRSPLNMFASRIVSKRLYPLSVTGMSVPELTYQYFRHAEDPVAWRKQFGGHLIPVLFDDFIADESYRRAIARQAGFSYKEISLDKVDTRYGGGSTYAVGNVVSPSVEDLKTRWQSSVDDPIFRSWVSEFASLVNEYRPQQCELDLSALAAQGVILSDNFRPSPVKKVWKKAVVGFVSILFLSGFVTSLGRMRRVFIPNKSKRLHAD